ncbi:protein-L-isoaspartate(D-aspartate) O-methyltransferase [Haliea sp. E1-2-M8]|uniref:protein-L-isoaspartate(D-aspartate) O-methyltransferase n=1 Tax=Haliea sp. E1-2-M8 TaxID=3064706 RepID=UPI00271FC35B|nr:protein-L-isoaspartate(D-aspartate) O-methyltransferase [Haliea sp. E1-2-M8]MDO8861247.1 protein-L-isoaspartate(D-aspartate) O-methyltransferase [Haliea sp. E1-2-M8]
MNSVDLNGIGMTSQRTRERLVQRMVEQGIGNQRVLDVMRTTPRHLFLDEAMAHRAYEDTALPIGFQQTLSQPYIVARMTELLLEQGPRSRVLEVGTGSGYQTAVLARLVEQVWSVERIKPLLDKARQRLRQLKLRNVTLRHADGSFGWEDAGPFDGILSTAAPERIPEELLRQLAPGGCLVIPVGGTSQHLQVVTRTSEGFDTRIVEAVRFVPLRPGTVK